MNHHLRILKQRIKTAALGDSRHVRHAGPIGCAENTERTLDEIIQREKKDLNARENDANIGHQLGMALAVQEQCEKDVNRRSEERRVGKESRSRWSLDSSYKYT